jgi:uncharacterized protein with HEPN domain
MDERDRENLRLVIEHADTVMEYALEPEWWKHKKTLDAVLMQIIQVAEAAKAVSPEGLAEVGDVPWANVKGIRSKIVHAYERIDVEIIRGVVTVDLPALVQQVRQVLDADEKH